MRISDQLRKIPGLAGARSRLNRELFYLKHNARDVYDTYLSRRRVPVVTPLGFKFGGLTSGHHLAMQEGTFEPQETKILGSLIAKSDVFVDVGANVGYYACLSRSLGKKTIAVEPMPVNLTALYDNLNANGWEDTEVVPMGCSQAPGVTTLFGASSTGASLLDNWAGAPSLIKRSISVSTLDILLGDRFLDDRITIKVDVEGHEYFTLLGASKLLHRSKRPVWLVEISLQQFHPNGSNPHFSDTFKLFWDQGYTALLLDEGRLAPVRRDDVDRWVRTGQTDSHAFNYLFIPPDAPNLGTEL